MRQVKEDWEVLSSPSADAKPRIASWSFSFSVCSHRPDLGVRGNRRSMQTNAFSKSFISALLPQMFRCHGVYYLLITHGLFICYKHCSRYWKEISMFSSYMGDCGTLAVAFPLPT